jgi:hypothetical protein
VLQKVELQTETAPPSVAVAVQANAAVSDYLNFVKKTGALLDNSVLGEGGRSAILAYGDNVDRLKAFDESDSAPALSSMAPHGSGARMYDAGMAALDLLQYEDPGRPRILLLIGQAADQGSKTSLETLKERAAEESVTVHVLALPIAGKRFVSETFSVAGKDGSGFVVWSDLMKLVPALRKGTHEAARSDPFSVLTEATGGIAIHFRKQAQLEDGLIAIGAAIRSSYLLLFSPTREEPGYHRLTVRVDVAGDRVYARPGYWRR